MQRLSNDLKAKVLGIRLCCKKKALFVELEVPFAARDALLYDMTEERVVALHMMFLDVLLSPEKNSHRWIGLTVNREVEDDACYEVWHEEHVDRTMERRMQQQESQDDEFSLNLHDDPRDVANIILDAWIERKVVTLFL
jgi:hypothetical protein